jgi:CheY-like chemotaxis protein
VAGEAGTGPEAVQLVRDADPDVVVMDIRMPGMDGIEATQLITAGRCALSRASAHHVRRR